MGNKLNVSSLGERKITGNKDQYRYNCPYCGDEGFHLYVQVKKQVYICHKCKVSGRLKDLGRPLGSVADLKSRVENAIGNARETDGGEGGKTLSHKTTLNLPEGFKLLTPNTGLPWRYLLNRDVTPKEIKKYQIGYCSEGLYGERIILPVYDQRGLVYFVARTYTNRIPKYLNAQSHRAGVIFKTFYGKVERAAIVEGIFGALRVGKVFPTIAILGKSLSEQQRDLIYEVVTDKAYIMLDPDAKKESMEVAGALNYKMGVVSMFLFEQCPDEMDTNTIRAILGEERGYANIHNNG